MTQRFILARLTGYGFTLRSETDVTEYLNEERGYTAKLHIELTQTDQLPEATAFSMLRSKYLVLRFQILTAVITKVVF